MTTNSDPSTCNAVSDVEGLQRAYARDNGKCIRSTTMFVAGTKDFPHGGWDDVSNIPFQTTYNSIRYMNADKALTTNDSLYTDHQITSIVGHSSGDSVVLEMQTTKSIYKFTNNY